MACLSFLRVNQRFLVLGDPNDLETGSAADPSQTWWGGPADTQVGERWDHLPPALFLLPSGHRQGVEGH